MWRPAIAPQRFDDAGAAVASTGCGGAGQARQGEPLDLDRRCERRPGCAGGDHDKPRNTPVVVGATCCLPGEAGLVDRREWRGLRSRAEATERDLEVDAQALRARLPVAVAEPLDHIGLGWIELGFVDHRAHVDAMRGSALLELG